MQGEGLQAEGLKEANPETHEVVEGRKPLYWWSLLTRLSLCLRDKGTLEIPNADDDQYSTPLAVLLKEEDTRTSEGRRSLLEGTRKTWVIPAKVSSQLWMENSPWRDKRVDQGLKTCQGSL